VRPYLENTHHKKRTGGMAQGVGLEFKPHYSKKGEESQCSKGKNKPRARAIDQVVEQLSSTHEALNSYPSMKRERGSWWRKRK
jgi:hypothetical protein